MAHQHEVEALTRDTSNELEALKKQHSVELSEVTLNKEIALLQATASKNEEVAKLTAALEAETAARERRDAVVRSPALHRGPSAGGGGGSLTRPKGAYGTTDEAFVLILLVCLSQPDSNSNRLHTGGHGGPRPTALSSGAPFNNSALGVGVGVGGTPLPPPPPPAFKDWAKFSSEPPANQKFSLAPINSDEKFSLTTPPPPPQKDTPPLEKEPSPGGSPIGWPRATFTPHPAHNQPSSCTTTRPNPEQSRRCPLVTSTAHQPPRLVQTQPPNPML